MKTLRLPFFLLLSLAVLSFTGCDDDEDSIVVETLNYDDRNDTAPSIDAGMFAAFFPADLVDDFAGRQLSEVEVFLADIPPSTKVFIYAEGDNEREPGGVLYESPDLTQRVNVAGAFFEHRLTTPLTLGNQGIWIAIETGIERGNRQVSVGCDAGLRFNPNGDRVRIGNEWTSLSELTGNAERINWNIRGVIAPE
ncbi:hypothetical protein [Lewinella sp. 4G2]|uniref:hypothetical protein n=1 Tax=Lewinella sp. 4G2 TaxID=1803372 RepID=UPI0007B4B8A4|nr:hypothetical protein [Lewinella sp. 4G2]OAV43388.1 hypothetical protein A3850_002245 [Lewinella sp. 4G2]